MTTKVLRENIEKNCKKINELQNKNESFKKQNKHIVEKLRLF